MLLTPAGHAGRIAPMEEQDLFTVATETIESALQERIKNLGLSLLQVGTDEAGNTCIRFGVRYDVVFGKSGARGFLVVTNLPDGEQRYEFFSATA